MAGTLDIIKRLIGGEIVGLGPDVSAGSIDVDGVSGLQQAAGNMLSFYKDPKYLNDFINTKAAAVIVPEDSELPEELPCPVIRVKDVDGAFNKAIALFVKDPLPEKRMPDLTSVISPGADVHDDVYVGACAVIEAGASVGKGSYIFPGVYIGPGATVGEDCIIYPNASIMHGVSIGNRVIIHSSVVVGSDGFGFVPTEEGIAKLPQIGTVVVEDDVEIGAGTTIDRARFDKTIISRGTKLDNLVHIAHNVVLGRGCMLAAQVGIAGSTVLGDYVQMGGQSGSAGHVKLGKGVMVAARGAVTRDHPDGAVLNGWPAQDRKTENEIRALVRRLPKMREELKNLRERIAKLEADAKNH